jgi:hypothetical protein
MAWASTLAADLASQKILLVLAGPILRQVTPTAVTVWVALRDSRSVTLIVSDTYGPDSGTDAHVQATATASTIQIGKYLHLLAVTARLPTGKQLTPGSIYFYDLVFDDRHGGTQHLSNAVGTNFLGSPVAYPPYDLPSFALPPADLTKLRIIHGSCRKAHGSGSDSLWILDGLINEGLQDGNLRPHQLFLTGDQIYADDVADGLLMAVSDAGETLLGWNEILPMPAFGSSSPTSHVADWPPEFRHCPMLVAGFTSDDLRSHLISLSEFLAMYLFAWSDVLWPAKMPTYADLEARAQPLLPALAGPLGPPTFAQYLQGPFSTGMGPYLKTAGISFSSLSYTMRLRFMTFTGKMGPTQPSPLSPYGFQFGWDLSNRKSKSDIDDDANDVATYKSSVTRIRRALANIPTYMICDDHEVTDDWNMTRNFCAGVYGSALGRRVMQNGLVAYSLCQGWGNTPEQFEGSAPGPAGLKLLQLLDQGTAQTYGSNEPALQKLVGVHDNQTLLTRPDNAVYHDQSSWLTVQGVQVSADSIVFNYTVRGPSHQVIVTDTRTWRSFPDGGDEPPELLPKSQVPVQVGGAVVPAEQVLLCILTTNAPPIEPIRSAARHPHIVGVYASDLWDSWDMGSVPLDRLFARLTDRLPTDGTGTLTGHIILLSGDVHHSFASRMVFRGSARFEDTQAKAVNAVFAQLVASAIKNQSGKTLDLHKSGYTYAPTGTGWLVPDHVPEYYAGWNVAPGTSYSPGTMNLGGFTVDLRLEKPTNQLPDAPAHFHFVQTPDYRYYLEYLSTAAQGNSPPTPPSLPAPGPNATDADRQKALANFYQASGYYRLYNMAAGKQRDIVGRNSLAEITFDWGAGNAKTVRHTLRWWSDDNPQQLVWTTYFVSLDPTTPASLVPSNET